MENGARKFFDLEKIRENYKLVIANFDEINTVISCKRDQFDDAVAENMLIAYNHINNHLASIPQNAILSWKEMLELNFIVHLGLRPAVRNEYYGFIRHTEERFETMFPPLKTWYERHEHSKDDPYKIAAGLFVRVLAQPQLFIEGNHRTGSLIANCYLLIKNENPFVMTPDNAVEFLNLASDVKFKSQNIGSKFKRALGWHDELWRMRIFLKKSAQPFTTGIRPQWAPEADDRQELESMFKAFRKRKAHNPSPQSS